MATPRYVYDPIKRQYLDVETGIYLTEEQMRAIRDAMADHAGVELRRKAEDAVKAKDDKKFDAVALAAFILGFGVIVKHLEISQYVLGRGGINAMTQEDFAAIEAVLADKQQYIEGFGQAIADTEMSAAQAGSRAELYAGVGSYDYGKASAYGIALPEHPGDNCLGRERCRCWWEFILGDGDTVEAYWQTQRDQSVCPRCLRNEREYAPFVATPADVQNYAYNRVPEAA